VEMPWEVMLDGDVDKPDVGGHRWGHARLCCGHRCGHARTSLDAYAFTDAVIVKAICAIASDCKTHTKVIRACESRLIHKHASVRRVAVQAFVAVAGNSSETFVAGWFNNDFVVEKLIRRLADPAASVRHVVLKCLQQISGGGLIWTIMTPRRLGILVHTVIPALVGRAKDPDVTVRFAALDVLAALNEEGNKVADGVCKFLADPEWEIRQSAVQILGELANRGFAPTTTDLGAALQWWTCHKLLPSL